MVTVESVSSRKGVMSALATDPKTKTSAHATTENRFMFIAAPDVFNFVENVDGHECNSPIKQIICARNCPGKRRSRFSHGKRKKAVIFVFATSKPSKPSCPKLSLIGHYVLEWITYLQKAHNPKNLFTNSRNGSVRLIKKHKPLIVSIAFSPPQIG